MEDGSFNHSVASFVFFFDVICKVSLLLFLLRQQQYDTCRKVWTEFCNLVFLPNFVACLRFGVCVLCALCIVVFSPLFFGHNSQTFSTKIANIHIRHTTHTVHTSYPDKNGSVMKIVIIIPRSFSSYVIQFSWLQLHLWFMANGEHISFLNFTLGE